MIDYSYLLKYVNISIFIMNLIHEITFVFVDILNPFFRNDLPQQYFIGSNLLDTVHVKGNYPVQV